MNQPSWISTHIQQWGQKPQLRYFYEQEIFRRILAFSEPTGISIEIGSGPGFLQSTMPSLICTDIVNGPTVHCLVDASQLPFKNNSVDCITIAFGLRNVTDKEMALRSMLRVLRPGGRLLVLEFSKPTSALLGKVYDQYSFQILPAMGRLIAQDADSYRYLAESIRKHPDQATLLGMMEDAGFGECRYHNMTGGIVALHQGFKP